MDNREQYAYSSIDVARCIIAMANEQRLIINITKVQKLLYIAYGVYMAVRQKRLTNELPQAWPYGPVFPATRTKFLHTDLYSITFDAPDMSEIRNDCDLRELISLVFRGFGSWSASQLTSWTHGEGTPWQKTTCHRDFVWGDTIPDEYIFPYFKKLVVRNG